MFEVVHKAFVLVFVDVEERASTAFDALDYADVVSHTATPPAIQEATTRCDCQLSVVLVRLHDKS